jgi:hypothetical protein
MRHSALKREHRPMDPLVANHTLDKIHPRSRLTSVNGVDAQIH